MSSCSNHTLHNGPFLHREKSCLELDRENMSGPHSLKLTIPAPQHSFLRLTLHPNKLDCRSGLQIFVSLFPSQHGARHTWMLITCLLGEWRNQFLKDNENCGPLEHHPWEYYLWRSLEVVRVFKPTGTGLVGRVEQVAVILCSFTLKSGWNPWTV